MTGARFSRTRRAAKQYEQTPTLTRAVEVACRAYGLEWLQVSGEPERHILGPRCWPVAMVLETLFAPRLEIRRPPRIPFGDAREANLRDCQIIDTQYSSEFSQTEIDIAFAAVRLTYLMRDLNAYDFPKLREPLEPMHEKLATALSKVAALLSDQEGIAAWNDFSKVFGRMPDGQRLAAWERLGGISREQGAAPWETCVS